VGERVWGSGLGSRGSSLPLSADKKGHCQRFSSLRLAVQQPVSVLMLPLLLENKDYLVKRTCSCVPSQGQHPACCPSLHQGTLWDKPSLATPVPGGYPPLPPRPAEVLALLAAFPAMAHDARHKHGLSAPPPSTATDPKGTNPRLISSCRYEASLACPDYLPTWQDKTTSGKSTEEKSHPCAGSQKH